RRKRQRRVRRRHRVHVVGLADRRLLRVELAPVPRREAALAVAGQGRRRHVVAAEHRVRPVGEAMQRLQPRQRIGNRIEVVRRIGTRSVVHIVAAGPQCTERRRSDRRRTDRRRRRLALERRRTRGHDAGQRRDHRGAQAGGRALTGRNRRHIVADYTSATNLRPRGARCSMFMLGGGVKKTALFAGLVLAAAAAALVLALRAAGKADAPGFFGAGTLLADVNIVLELLLVGGLTFGMMLAKSGNIAAHRVNQSAWVMVNAALVALIMIPSIRTFKLAHLSDLGNSGNLIVVVHAAIGAATL